MNEAFKPASGPGMGGPGMGGPGMGGPGMGGGGRGGRGGMGGPGGGGPGGPGGFPAGPGGGPGAMGGFVAPVPGEILPSFLRDQLQLTAEQKKALDLLQKETDASVGKMLTEEQRKMLKEMRDGIANMGGGPGGFPGGPGGPGGFPGGPGGFPGGPSGPGGFPGGPGMGGPGMGGGGGVTLDPLVALNDSRKPLRSKVLAVPSLKAKYLANIRQIANESLDWKTLGPVVASYRKLIEDEVKADTRKLESFTAFEHTTADQPTGAAGGRDYPLRTFADQRRKFLIDYKEGSPAPMPKGKN